MIQTLYYVGMVVIMLLALIPLVKNWAEYFKDVGDDEKIHTRPLYILIPWTALLIVAALFFFAGSAHKGDGFAYHAPAEPRSDFVEQVKQDAAEVKPQTRKDLEAERRGAEEAEKSREESEAVEQSGQAASELMRFRENFPALNDDKKTESN